MAAVYVFPCLIAGWAFGASGGLLVGFLSAPMQAWLASAGVAMPPSRLVAGLALASALVAGLSAGLSRDLRERLRERTEQLSASESRYRQLIDNTPEGVIVHDRGVILFANPSLARMVGIADGDALVGRTVVGLAPFEDREILGANFVLNPMRTNVPRTVEARLSTPDGGSLTVVMTSMPIDYRGADAWLILVRPSSLVRTHALPITRASFAADASGHSPG